MVLDILQTITIFYSLGDDEMLPIILSGKALYSIEHIITAIFQRKSSRLLQTIPKAL